MGAIVRGDVHWIRIGARCNIQDLCVAHVSHGTHPLRIGDDVTVGHHAVVHGCTIHDRVLVGIGARVLDGAVLESEVIIGAGALVAPGSTIPQGSLALGIPARVVRQINAAERTHILELSVRYVGLARIYAQDAASHPAPDDG